MGAWNVSINGNDTAQDLKSEYQIAFFYYDEQTALQKIDEYVRQMFDENDQEEWCNYIYFLADYMWKHGRLTDDFRNQVFKMIDGGFGLDIWAESGEKILQKRKKVLQEFRDKLLSPQSSKKKITVYLYMKPIFELGDLVAIQLKTAKKHYIPKSAFSEEEFRKYDGHYVVLRKVDDHISYVSSIVPEVKDIWPRFQLYGKIFDHCPTLDEVKNVPLANTLKLHSNRNIPNDGIIGCEGSMFYFRKRNYQLIGNDCDNMPQISSNINDYINRIIYFSIDKPWSNADTSILTAIL